MRRSPQGRRSSRCRSQRLSSLLAVTAVGAALLAVSALAGTIVGTPHGDMLRGTAKADKLYGKAGNDKL
jgi:hypothetical protein